MAIKKYVRVPYRHQSWPKMVYHPVSGAYTIVKSESEIPQGFVESLAESEYKGGVQPAQCHDFTVPEMYITGADKESDDDADDVDKVPSLKELNMTRKEAMDILTEEGSAPAGNITNAKLAELISKIM